MGARYDRGVTFSFARMTLDDLRLLHRWLQEPHVRAFYDREPQTLEGVAANYRDKIRGDEPTEPYIASLDATPIGYLQTYRFADYPDYARAIDVGSAAAGVDMLIGEPAYAHRGLGAPLLRQFVDDVVWHAHVLLFATRVRETEIDEFDPLFLHELECVGYRHWISSVFFIRKSF